MTQDTKAKFSKLNKWFMVIFNGLGADLLFYIAIDTLFLTTVKGLSSSDIALLTTVATLFCLVSYFPISILINKIKKQYCVIIKYFFLLLSIILYTFGANLLLFILADVLYELAFLFGQMSFVIFRNNLEASGQKDEYVNLRGKSRTVYSIVTFIIALVAGYLFAMNSYLPMYLCIAVTSVMFVLSFFYKEIKIQPKEQNIKQKKFSIKFLFTVFTFILICSAVFVTRNLSTIQKYSRLAIQYTFQDAGFGAERIAIILGYIVIGSRIVRILGSMIFPKIYSKTQNKRNLIVFIPIILLFASLFVTFGLAFNFNYILKIILISIGFYLCLMIIDTYAVIIEDVVLSNSTEQTKSSNMILIKFLNMIANFLLNFVAFSLLENFPMYVLFIVLAVFCVVGIFVAHRISGYIKK